VTIEPRVEELLASIRKAIDDDLGGISAPPSTKTSGNSQGTLMRGALREMRVNFDPSAAGREQADGEISQLRERIGRSRTDSAFAMNPPAPKPHVPRASVTPEPARRNGIGSILSGELARPEQPPRQPPVLRQTYVEEAPRYAEEAQHYVEPPVYEAEYQEQVWEEHAEKAPQQDYYEPAYAPQPSQGALVSPSTAYSAQNSFQQLTDAIMARASGDRSIEDITQNLLRGMLKTWLDDNLPQLVEKLVREEIERVARRGR
jgi:uncharacterized protein